jgi:hypothetical protein
MQKAIMIPLLVVVFALHCTIGVSFYRSAISAGYHNDHFEVHGVPFLLAFAGYWTILYFSATLLGRPERFPSITAIAFGLSVLSGFSYLVFCIIRFGS